MHRVTISCYLQLCFEVASVFDGPGDRCRGVILYCSLFKEQLHKKSILDFLLCFFLFVFFPELGSSGDLTAYFQSLHCEKGIPNRWPREGNCQCSFIPG